MNILLGRVRVVLVGTSHPGNIGAAARALKTMGLVRLVLVAPHAFPDPVATAMAAGADDVLAAAEVRDTLDEALADCRLVLGCSARTRGVALPQLTPREAAAQMLDAAAGGGDVALLFGSERVGLTNEELQRCHAAVHIPAAPEYSSLNLAAAVQVLCYELRMGALARSTTAEPAPAPEIATHEQLEGFFAHLERALAEIDFFKGRASGTMMQRLRRLFLRAAPSERELLILRGILADAQRMARLAAVQHAADEHAPEERS